MYDAESPEGIAGEHTERMIREYLGRSGGFVLPTATGPTGGASLAEERLAKVVTPDILYGGGGKVHWIEVKYKSRPFWIQIQQTWQTGVDSRNWKDYLACESSTGMPGWMVQYVKETTIGPVLLVASFAILAGNEAPNINNSRMTYWTCDTFEWRKVPQEVHLLDIPEIPRGERRPWALPDKLGNDRLWAPMPERERSW